MKSDRSTGNFKVLGIEYCDRELTAQISGGRQPQTQHQGLTILRCILIIRCHGYMQEKHYITQE